MIREVYIS